MGQNKKKTVPKIKIDLNQLKQDTTPTALYQRYFGNLDSLYNDYRYMRRIKINPHYYRLFVPLTYYYAPIKQITAFEMPELLPDPEDKITEKLLPYNKRRFNYIERINKRVNNALMDIYLKKPELVVNTEDRIMSVQSFAEVVEVVEKPKTSILSLFAPDPVNANKQVGEAEIIIHKPNFWVTGGNGSLQFTQNYISENWYKGGESNNSLLGHLQLFANYNDKEKIQFENLFEAKIGFNTVPSDTVRKYRINTDVLRLYSKIGVQAAARWYYTASAEINTQFFNNYKANSNDIVSSFLSPGNLTLSIGMDYKLKKSKFDLSVFISPGAYNLRYVMNGDVDETKFGLEEGKKFLHDIGSKLQATLAWKIIPTITLNSRFYYFTNYEKVEAEWENTIDFILNRYLSTKLFVHGRFDDGVPKKGDNSFFQLKELLSFGINYKW